MRSAWVRKRILGSRASGVLRSGVKEETASRRRGTPAEQSARRPWAREVQAQNGRQTNKPSNEDQSACLRKKAGISKSSMPPEAKASTFAAAWVRLVRHTLGTAMEL